MLTDQTTPAKSIKIVLFFPRAYMLQNSFICFNESINRISFLLSIIKIKGWVYGNKPFLQNRLITIKKGVIPHFTSHLSVRCSLYVILIHTCATQKTEY